MNQLEYHAALEDYNKWRLQPDNSLTHWGILGQKWGVRRYQNEDGSLTPEGEERYNSKKKKEEQKLANKQTKFEAKIQRKNARSEAKNDAIRIRAEQEADKKASDNAVEAAKISNKTERKSNSLLAFGLTAAAGVAAYAIYKNYQNKRASMLLEARKARSAEKANKKAEELIKEVKEIKASEISKSREKFNVVKAPNIKQAIRSKDMTATSPINLHPSKAKYNVVKAPKLADLTATSKVNISDAAFNKAIVSSENNRKIRKAIKSSLAKDRKSIANMLGISEKELLKMNHSEDKVMNIDEYYASLKNNTDFIEHHGIKGQKWGVRRYQNEDGSLTPEGEERYGIAVNRLKKHQERLLKDKQELKENKKELVKDVAIFEGVAYGGLGAAVGFITKGPLGALIGGGTGGLLGTTIGALKGAFASTGPSQSLGYRNAQKLIDKYSSKELNGKDLEKFTKKAFEMERMYNNHYHTEKDTYSKYNSEKKDIYNEFKTERKAAPRSKSGDN